MMTDKSLLQRLDVLESEDSIRRLMVTYLEALDRHQDAASIADLFSSESVWEAVGPLASILGTHRGQEAKNVRGGSPDACKWISSVKEATGRSSTCASNRFSQLPMKMVG
jgi:SnoaL-like domain